LEFIKGSKKTLGRKGEKRKEALELLGENTSLSVRKRIAEKIFSLVLTPSSREEGTNPRAGKRYFSPSGVKGES